MAKYTMLLTEYLESGGQLPASFSLIEGFEDLFVERFCDCELGFETPNLFEIKLDLRAKIVMPYYVEKINHLTQQWLHFDAPVKTHYSEEDTTFNAGAQHSEAKVLPINIATAEPNTANDLNAYENTENKSRTLNESGETHDELITAIEFLNRDIRPMLETLLNEFSMLFMKVY